MAYVAKQHNLMRLFVAIDMPKAVQDEIAVIQEKLRALDLIIGSYVKPEQAHVTLQFLGYIEMPALIPVRKILQSVVFTPISAELGKLGVFSDEHGIKVIWLDLLGSGIKELVYQIEQKCALGVKIEAREFLAHVTLVRVKSIKDTELLEEHLQKIAVRSIQFTITEFVLKQSLLSSDGPMYIDLERYQAVIPPKD